MKLQMLEKKPHKTGKETCQLWYWVHLKAKPACLCLSFPIFMGIKKKKKKK